MPDSRQREGTGSSSSKAAVPDPLIGQVINGRFKIVSVIARGGMGKVYRAEQAPLGRICALKVLSPKYEGDRDPEFHKRFFLEASTAAKLTHPNTVTVFDYGQSDDVYYIAMEYIEGRTLHRVLREEGPFSEARTAHIARQICRSLREAHGLGVVHRDLKPGNVLLVTHEDEQDNVKVLDFGLVKDTESNEDLTQQGLFMGSPKYMAPEQITGGGVSARTDIYALGVMMYEMVTGHVPFDKGASVGTLMSHVHDRVPLLTEQNPNVAVSPAMEALIYRCLEKDPEKRYASMNDLLVALKRTGGEGGLTDTSESLPAMGVPMGRPSRPSFTGSGEYTAASGPISNPPITYSGPISSDSGSQPPVAGAPVFVAPPITDSMGPRPEPPRQMESVAPPRASGLRKAAPLAIGAVLAVGVIVVAVMRSSSPGPQQATPTPPETGAVTAPPAAAPPTAAPTQAPTAAHDAQIQTRKVQLDSNPSGAAVLEGARELCAATPCEVEWRGDAAAPSAQHELSFEKKGYKSVKIKVTAAEDKVKAKLELAPATGKPGGGIPQGYKDDPFAK
ncbi:MAG: protein kinase [Polyangiaceae bacterium]|nr:protein kinase [Polyangiaceae bacterium]